MYIHVHYFRQKIQNSLMQYVHVHRSHKDVTEITQTDVGVSTRPTTYYGHISHYLSGPGWPNTNNDCLLPVHVPWIQEQLSACANLTQTSRQQLRTGIMHTQYCYCWIHHSKGHNVHTYILYEVCGTLQSKVLNRSPQQLLQPIM